MSSSPLQIHVRVLSFPSSSSLQAHVRVNGDVAKATKKLLLRHEHTMFIDVCQDVRCVAARQGPQRHVLGAVDLAA
jgi:hypothetical protein